MKQANMFDAPDPIKPDDHDPDCERDLFGQPIKRTGPAAPTYRPRKPVQQGFAFDTFNLTGDK